MTPDLTPYDDPDDPLSDADAERIIGAANDPFNKLFPPITPLNEMLRDLRKARKLTQNQLAARLHTDQANISKWESGEQTPQQDTLIRIAQALEVDASVLLRAREFERTDMGEMGYNPKMLMVADRVAKLPMHLQDWVFTAFDGIVRLAEEAYEHGKSERDNT